MTAAYLDREVAYEMFGPSTGILAWGPPGSPYEAQPVEGGYRISGRRRGPHRHERANERCCHEDTQQPPPLQPERIPQAESDVPGGTEGRERK
jgi:hypothetical protein